ncbi:MAG: rhodanese-like domain-containing protein [Proteobacteria bacterium]|nr:rhodanese-like domain-containing protein [Pseudomonadota bacterium]
MGLRKIFLICLVLAAFTVACAKMDQTQRNTAGEEKTTAVVKVLEPKDAHEFIRANRDNPDFVILDVRTPEEFESGHIENAVNINYHAETFAADLDGLNKSKTYVVYCRTGRRSSDTVSIMARQGFKNVYRIAGDIVRWKAEKLPLAQLKVR